MNELDIEKERERFTQWIGEERKKIEPSPLNVWLAAKRDALNQLSKERE